MDKIFVVNIDKAIFLGQTMPGEHFRCWEDSEYKTLAFIPVRIGKEGRALLPAVSKDRIRWKFCFGAAKNDKELDLREMTLRAETGCHDIVFKKDG